MIFNEKTGTRLLASEIKRGHCVIVNDIDAPCSKLVAVVIEVEGDIVVARYLAASVDFKRSCRNQANVVTPVEHFGYRVDHDRGHFRCSADATLQERAKYPDGEPRRWQDWSRVDWRPTVPDVAVIATDAAHENQQ